MCSEATGSRASATARRHHPNPAEAHRAGGKRLRLPRQKANDGKVLVSVDLSEINHKPLAARAPADLHPVIASLKARIEVLQMELARIEVSASSHRADFERERERVDALMAELLKMTADAMAAKEAAARLEGGQVRLRKELSDVHSDRDASRSEVERLILIDYRRSERERLPWWKRLMVWAPNSNTPSLSASKAS